MAPVSTSNKVSSLKEKRKTGKLKVGKKQTDEFAISEQSTKEPLTSSSSQNGVIPSSKTKTIRKISRKCGIKQPLNRKILIRDLPKSAAAILHPALRNILTSRQKRWNSGSPQHRIAVNLVKRYKKRLVPRVMPFFCDKCRMNTRSIKAIRNHYCEPVNQRRADRLEYARKFKVYDCSVQIKLAQNPEKQWRQNSMACMEQSLWPDKVLKPVPIITEEDQDEVLDSSLNEQDLAAQQDEYDDPVEHFQLSDVLVPATLKKPVTTLKYTDRSAIFCFHCKETYKNFNQYQLHLHEDFNEGLCSDKLPEYHYVERNDKTETCNKNLRHSIVRHRPMKRDVSHVQCTLCKRGNFSGTKELFTHMMECAASEGQPRSVFSGSHFQATSPKRVVEPNIVHFNPTQFD